MGKVTGFIEFDREKQPYRPVEERLKDYRQVMQPWPVEPLKTQASRCMDCGIPFCHQGCPLGNMIPDWNDLVYRDQWNEAIHLEFRLCKTEFHLRANRHDQRCQRRHDTSDGADRCARFIVWYDPRQNGISAQSESGDDFHRLQQELY